MRAMILDVSAEIDESPPPPPPPLPLPLTLREVEPPRPDAGELRVRITPDRKTRVASLREP